MNTQTNALPESPIASREIAPAAFSFARLMYWSVRRELEEYRFIYLAPLVVAAIALFSFTLSIIAGIWEQSLRLDPRHHLKTPFDMAAGLLMLTGILVSVFYCLDALHGERRDRSILFWKSLPVSDLTTVLSKASIPLVIFPLLTFAISLAMQWMMLLVGSAVLLVTGQSIARLWTNLSAFQMPLLLLYHLLTAHALWPAPVYCWLLLVSGWARRAPFLWAVLPLVVIAGIENLAFHTWHFASLVGSRFIGNTSTITSTPDVFPTDPMTHITPGHFLATPGLWIGLAVAAAFLAAAVRLRRYQGPI